MRLGTRAELLGPLGTVLGTTAIPPVDTRRIQGAAHDVVADAREILDTPTTNQDDRVLLQCVAYTGDIRIHFTTVGETNPRHLPKRGVRLLRRLSKHSQADTTSLGTLLEVGRL